MECGTEEKRKERTRRKERKERKERWGNRKGNKLRKLFRLGLFSFVSAECIMLRVFLRGAAIMSGRNKERAYLLCWPSCRRDAAARINPFCVII